MRELLRMREGKYWRKSKKRRRNFLLSDGFSTSCDLCSVRSSELSSHSFGPLSLHRSKIETINGHQQGLNDLDIAYLNRGNGLNDLKSKGKGSRFNWKSRKRWNISDYRRSRRIKPSFFLKMSLRLLKLKASSFQEVEIVNSVNCEWKYREQSWVEELNLACVRERI